MGAQHGKSYGPGDVETRVYFFLGARDHFLADLGSLHVHLNGCSMEDVGRL